MFSTFTRVKGGNTMIGFLMCQYYIFLAALVMLSHSVGSPVNSELCASGEIRHKKSKSDYRCCKPWRFECPINYPYTICESEGGWDACVKCGPGFIQPNPSNSTHQMSCYKNNHICEEGKIPLQSSAKLSGWRPQCICDQASNYFPIMGLDVCDYKSVGCPLGQELQGDGNCEDCSFGSYKNWTGKGPCIPWTNCESQGLRVKTRGNSVHDNICCYTSGQNLSKDVLNTIELQRLANGTDISRENHIQAYFIVTKNRGRGKGMKRKKAKGKRRRKGVRRRKGRRKRKNRLSGKDAMKTSESQSIDSKKRKVPVKQLQNTNAKRRAKKSRRRGVGKKRRSDKRKSRKRKGKGRRRKTKRRKKTST